MSILYINNKIFSLRDEEMKTFQHRYESLRQDILKRYPVHTFSYEEEFPQDIRSIDYMLSVKRLVYDGRAVSEEEFEDAKKFARFEFEVKMAELRELAINILSEMGIDCKEYKSQYFNFSQNPL